MTAGEAPAILKCAMDKRSVKALKRLVWLEGYDWTDEDLERLLPQLEKSLELVERLDTLPLRDVEPVLQYRML